jgi:hypothetical protein
MRASTLSAMLFSLMEVEIGNDEGKVQRGGKEKPEIKEYGG